MNENQNIEAAIAEAITHVSSRRLGAVVLGMFFLAQVEGPAWMILALGLAYIVGRVVMDLAPKLLGARETDDGESAGGNVPDGGDRVLHAG